MVVVNIDPGPMPVIGDIVFFYLWELCYLYRSVCVLQGSDGRSGELIRGNRFIICCVNDPNRQVGVGDFLGVFLGRRIGSSGWEGSRKQFRLFKNRLPGHISAH